MDWETDRQTDLGKMKRGKRAGETQAGRLRERRNRKRDKERETERAENMQRDEDKETVY